MTKKENYEMLLQQVESLVAGETNWVGVLANVTAAIHDTMHFFWVGFYLVQGKELVLGPFQGSVACFRIPCNKGVCGTAWSRRETVIVEDVDKFPGHIACSSLSRSAIVVPIFNQNGEVCAVLDIDSTDLATFDTTDQYYLERMMQTLAHVLFTTE